MKLHKTRDGGVKVRGVEGVPDVARGDLYGVESPVAVSWKDERGSWWSLRMTDEEAEALAASILEAVPSALGQAPIRIPPDNGVSRAAAALASGKPLVSPEALAAWRDAALNDAAQAAHDHIRASAQAVRDRMAAALVGLGVDPAAAAASTAEREPWVYERTALDAWDESVGHPLREAIIAGFAEHRDADRLLRESQEVEAMGRRFARALRRGR